MNISEIVNNNVKILKLEKKSITSKELNSTNILPDIKEIHIHCETLHINDDLEKFYRGKSILVESKKIYVGKESIWDLSGRNALDKSTMTCQGELSTDNTEIYEMQGEDGGDCDIICNEIINSSLWTVISNGGNGLDGKLGINGSDGKKVKSDDFKFELKSKITKENILQFLRKLDISSDIGSRRKLFYENGFEKFVIFNKDLTKLELLVLIKGSEGKPGEIGGKGGKGGNPGKINQIFKLRKSEKGKDGNYGSIGQKGMDGSDAFMLITSNKSKPIFVGLDEQKKFQISESNIEQKNSIYYQPLKKFLHVTEIEESSESVQLKSVLKDAPTEFGEALICCLKNSNKQFDEIKQSLKVQEFLNKNIDFNSFLRAIIENRYDIYGYDHLKYYAKCLTSHSISNEQKIIVILEEFFASHKVTRKSNGTYEIKGMLIISEAIQNIIESLGQDFNEIHIICDILHINSNLSARGKNIAILANSIHIHNQVEWDLSGQEQIFSWSEAAGQDLNGLGINGKNGQSGGNGGNFSAEWKSIINPSLWTIKSNGGTGSSGQKGGDGKESVNGRNPTESDFILDNVTLKNNRSKWIENGLKKYIYVESENNYLMMVKGTHGKIGKTFGVGGSGGCAGIPGNLSIRSTNIDEVAEIQKISFYGTKGTNGINGKSGENKFRDGCDTILYVKNGVRKYLGLNKLFTFQIQKSEKQRDYSVRVHDYYYNPKMSHFMQDSKATSLDASFFENLISVFRNSFKQFNNLADKLQLKKYTEGEIFLGEVASNVIQNKFTIPHYATLKETAETFKNNDNKNAENIKKQISDFLAPIKIQQSSHTVEVKKKILMSSEFSSLKYGTEVKEFHIICDTLHIDSNLSPQFFGKNLAIFTNLVEVHGQYDWDLSDIHVECFKSDAGQDNDGRGRDGQDGAAGKCGGNFKLVCKYIENGSSLKIISNGSNGCNGQNGGNGRNGMDGRDANRTDFFIGDKEIKSGLQFDHSSYDSSKVIEKYHNNSFTKMKYRTNNELTGEVYANGSLMLVLVRGSSPDGGKLGGLGGHGGEKGYPGEIDILCEYLDDIPIKQEKNVGKAGRNGFNGYNGTRGREGADIWKFKNFWTDAEYRGENKHIKYKIERESYFSLTRNLLLGLNMIADRKIHWPEENCYIKVVRCHEIQNPDKRKYKNDSVLTRSKEKHAEAKKNLSINVTRSQHSQYLDEIFTKIMKSESHFENVRENAISSLAKSTKNPEINMDSLKREHESFLSMTFNTMESFQISTTRHVDYDNKKSLDLREFEVAKRGYKKLTLNQIDKEKINRKIQDLSLKTHHSNIIQIFNNFLEIKAMDSNDNSNICANKIIPFFEDIFKKISQMDEGEEIKDEISSDPHQFSKKIWFLRKSMESKFNFKVNVLNKHFNESSSQERTEVAEYFEKNIENFRSSLAESIFNYFIRYNYMDHSISEIINDFVEKSISFDENFNKIDISNTDSEKESKKEEDSEANKKFMSMLEEFYGKDEIKKFIKNDIERQGIQSPLYRKILAHKYGYRFVICRHNLNDKLSVYEWHNYGDDLRFNYFENEVDMNKYENNSILNSVKSISNKIKAKIGNPHKQEPQPKSSSIDHKEEVFILMEDRQFSLLNFDAKYNHFEWQEKYNETFNEIAFILENYDQSNDYDFLNKQILNLLTDCFQKHQIEQSTIAEILKAGDSNNDEKILFEIVILFFPKIFNKVQDDEFESDSDLEIMILEKMYEKHENCERVKIKWLFKLISKIGGMSILRAITVRVINENNLQNLDEFLIFLKSIFTILTKNEGFVQAITFLILGNKQDMWIPEIIMIKLGIFLGKIDKDKRRKWKNILENNKNSKIVLTFLNKILSLEKCEYKESSNIQEFDKIIENMDNFDEDNNEYLQNTNLLMWGSITTDKYWNTNLRKLSEFQQFSDYEDIKIKFEDMHNKYGPKVRNLMEIVVEKKETISKTNLQVLLANFMKGKWFFCEKILHELKNLPTEKWFEHLNENFNSSEDINNSAKIIEMMESCDETSSEIKKQIAEIKSQVNKIHEQIKIFENLGEMELLEMSKNYKKLTVEELLAMIIKVFQFKANVCLRDTQIISILTMLNSSNGVLMQVSTGEGKTFIGIAFSILKVLQGEKVDIVTSSSVLAIRDATKKEHKEIFEFFNIKVGHNCHETSTERKKTYAGDIVYGTLCNFQRDFLLTEFHEQKIMPNHHLKNILVDEVDSMLLDKGNNILYLSQDLPDVDEIESVLIFIWQWVNQNFNNSAETIELSKINMIRKIVLDTMYGILDEDDIKLMQPGVDAVKVMKILKDSNIIAEENLICEKSFNETTVSSILNMFDEKLIEKINVYCREKIKQEKQIKIPNHLKNFMLQHLNQWIENAFRALFLEVRKEYLIDIPKTGNTIECPNINIIDLDTGTEMSNSQWNEGLHQFLQLKHGCKLSPLSLKSVFISNVSFFKKYNKLYGMTGTLGSIQEREKITKIHKINFVTIPRYVSRKFEEYQPMVKTNEKEWLNEIIIEVKKMLNEDRSVLIICETIQDTEKIRHRMCSSNQEEDKFVLNDNIILYQRDSDKFNISELKQRSVIISTNLAGRGTDIKLSQELNKSGGLHVILTALPNNSRIEEQAFGRAARSGERGSGRLIIFSSGNETMSRLKESRNQFELERLDQISIYYENFVKIEESFFKKFRLTYMNLKKVLHDNKEIYLRNFVIQWSFWLDNNSKLLDEWKNSNNSSVLQQNFEEFLTEKKTLHPIMRILLYNEFINKNKYEEANKLISEDLFQEDLFVHQYFKLYGMLRMNQEKSGYKTRNLLEDEQKQIRKCLKMLQSSICFRHMNIQMVNHLRMNYQENSPPLEGFQDQQRIILEVFEEIFKSLMVLMGENVNTESLGTEIIDLEVMKNELYEELINKNCITPPRISSFYTSEDIEKVSKKHKIKFDDLRNFLKVYASSPIKSMREFQDSIKKNFQLPSRDEFWKALLKKQILCNDEEYAIIDMDIIKDVDPSAGEVIEEKFSAGKFPVSSDSNVFFSFFDEKNLKEEKGIIVKMLDLQSEFSQPRIDYLKNNNVLEINREAKFDEEEFRKLKNIKIFNNFDEIRKEDFKIVCKDYQRIVDKLENLQILTCRSNNTYALNYENLEKIFNPYDLKDDYVFHSSIYDLIQSKFAYRIALEALADEINTKNTSSSIRLAANPAMNLLNDLLIQLIIEQAKVDKEKTENCDKIFKRSNFKDILTQAGLSIDSNLIMDLKCNKLINDDDTIKIFDINEVKLSKQHQKDESTIKLLLRNRKILEDNVPQVKSRLELLITPFLDGKLDRIEVILKRIDEFLPNKELLLSMELKGLGAIIKVQQQLYGFPYWTRFSTVLGCSLFQIFSGIALSVLFGRFSSNFGSTLINEGVNDAVFALSTLRSGYFCWNDFKKHKMTSVAMSFVAFASEIVLSKIKWFKKAGNEANISTSMGSLIGGHLENTTGYKLIKDYKWVAAKKVMKTTVLKTVTNFKSVLVNVGINNIIEHIIERYSNQITERISKAIVECIQKDFYSHKIAKTIENMLKFFTRNDLENLIKEKFQNILVKFENLKNLLKKVVIEIDSIIQSSETTKNWISEFSSIITKVVDIPMITIFVRQMFDNLNAELAAILKTKRKGDEIESISNDNLNEFKSNLSNQFKKVASIQYTNAINSTILKPTLVSAGTKITKTIENSLKESISYHRENKLNNRSNMLLQLTENLENSSDYKYYDIPETLVNDLMDIRMRTKNPELYEFLMRLNIPFDEIGIECVRRVIEEKLNKTIIFLIYNNGIKHEMGYINDKNAEIIRLDLINGHFKNENKGIVGNDCLYYALREKIPELLNTMTPNDLRKAAADIINKRHEIKNAIISYDKEFYFEIKFFGGGRRKISRTGNQYGKYRDICRDFPNRKILNIEIDHTPPKKCYEGTIYDKNSGDMPSIVLPHDIHRKSLTTGNSLEVRKFRAKQHEYMKNGQIEKAIEMQLKNQHDTTVELRFNKSNFREEINRLHENQMNLINWCFENTLFNSDKKNKLLEVVNGLKDSLHFGQNVKESCTYNIL